MANKAISELPQAQNVNNQDLFVLEQSGIAKKLTAETFITEQGIIDALAEALDGHGGIQSVTLSSVSGRIRTYRITFTDQSATTFQVYDGTSIDRISRTSSSGLDDVYTIFLSDGTTTFFTVHNGADGNVSEAMLNDALKDKAPAVTETTESGAIATFSDGADDMPLHNILAEINPVQDLTYGDPYPAGSGKNKMVYPYYSSTPQTFNGVTFTANSDGSITANGTATANAVYTIHSSMNLADGTYILSGGKSAYKYLGLGYYNSDSATIETRVNNNATSGATFTAHKGTVTYIQLVINNGQSCSNEVFYPMIRPSSVSDESFAPYSNICPITGWAGCNVTRTGANVWDEVWEQGGVNPSDGTNYADTRPRIRSKNYIPVVPNTQYYFALPNTVKVTAFYDINKQFISGSWNSALTFTTPANAYYMRFCTNDEYGATYNNNISINYPSTDTAYHAFTGSDSVSLSWQTEAGTVYGGTIDVATGLLTVDRAMVAYNSSSGFAAHASGRWYHEGLPSGADKSKREEAISNQATYRDSNNNNPYFSFGGSGVYVNKITADETIEQFSARLQANPMQICYFLATPQTYQLTPQQIMTLLGTNNVWTDMGNVSVTYPADTKMYIQNLTQPTEDDLVANQAITSGKYFMVGNSLYLALANIASGAQITIGTNAQRVSLADALNTINS